MERNLLFYEVLDHVLDWSICFSTWSRWMWRHISNSPRNGPQEVTHFLGRETSICVFCGVCTNIHHGILKWDMNVLYLQLRFLVTTCHLSMWGPYTYLYSPLHVTWRWVPTIEARFSQGANHIAKYTTSTSLAKSNKQALVFLGFMLCFSYNLTSRKKTTPTCDMNDKTLCVYSHPKNTHVMYYNSKLQQHSINLKSPLETT